MKEFHTRDWIVSYEETWEKDIPGVDHVHNRDEMRMDITHGGTPIATLYRDTFGFGDIEELTVYSYSDEYWLVDEEDPVIAKVTDLKKLMNWMETGVEEDPELYGGETGILSI